MKMVETGSQTPPPVENNQPVSINEVYRMMDLYYEEVDVVNKVNYDYGKLLDKDVVTSQRDVLRDLVYVIIEDIKAEPGVNTSQINIICESIITIIKLLPTLPQTSQRNKKLLSKMIGYFIELHKRHN